MVPTPGTYLGHSWLCNIVDHAKMMTIKHRCWDRSLIRGTISPKLVEMYPIRRRKRDGNNLDERNTARRKNQDFMDFGTEAETNERTNACRGQNETF